MRRVMRSLVVLLTLFSLNASAQTFDDIRVYASGGKSSTTWHGQTDLQAVTLELGRSLSPRTTVAIAATPLALWQPRSWFGNQFGDGNESVHALHAALLIRHTFATESRLQWYVEAATGPMIAEKRVPAATSRFNFITHGGAGVVLNARGRMPVLVGYRFMHISNGGYSPRNPGLNVSAAVLGVQLRSATRRRR
jgi:lipid A 3-O-deacylase